MFEVFTTNKWVLFINVLVVLLLFSGFRGRFKNKGVFKRKMISLNKYLREKHGLFSAIGLKTIFFIPETYFAGSIGDFCREKKQVKKTGWSPFQPKRRCHKNSQSIIFFPSCYFRKTAEPDYTAIKKNEEEFFEDMDRRIFSKNPPSFSKQHEEIEEFCKKYVQSYNNGELYDAGQFSLPIRFFGEVPEKKTLYRIKVLYDLEYDCCTLIKYSDHLDYGQSEKKAKRSLLTELVNGEFVKGFLPQPA